MSKCNYCAFFSRACANPDWEKYTNDICNEILVWSARLGQIDVPTIFFGGGTPSLMPSDCLERIIKTISDNFRIVPDAEITMESNPATLDVEKLRAVKSIGVNRISIGVQSLDDDKLKFLGRKHNAHDALMLIENSMKMGLRTSADFIYGLPEDTVDDVVTMCNQINKLGLTHCSMYELTIEANTPFGRAGLIMPNNDTMAQMYMMINQTLNLPRYEVSNYCAAGNECRHNQNVWDGEPYVGIGAGAAGRVLIDGVWYEQMGNGSVWNMLDCDARAIEKIITGMRTIRGCRLTDDVKNVIDINWVNDNPELVTVHDNRIAPTERGMIVLDDVITKLVK